MMNVIKLVVLTLILTLTLTGCGDLFGKKKVDKPLKPIKPGADCELDMEAINHIMEANISAQLNCLGAKLESFMDFEEAGDGKYLVRESLINFLKATRPDISPQTLKVIETVFALNHLITGEKEDHVSRENVGKIIKLGVLFNRQAWMHFNHTFRSKLPVRLDLHNLDRRTIQRASWELQAELAGIYKPWRNGKTHSLNLVELIGSFLKAGDTESLEKIKGVLFAKKVILGGNKEILTHLELGRLFSNLPKLLTIVLDAVRLQYIDLDQKDSLRLAKDDLFELTGIIFDESLGNRSKENFFHMDEAIEGIQSFLNSDTDLVKYRALIHEGMRIITQKPPDALGAEVTNGPYWITGGDIEKIINHLSNITGKGLAFHQMYVSEKFKGHMSSPMSLNLDPKEFEQYFPGQKAELQDFVRIANRYRFQKGIRDISYYGTDIKRNVQAFFEAAAFEYGIRLVFRFYGSSLSMGKDQVVALLKKFENELIETGIMMPRRASNTAETITLLGSLFQYQSDNNKVLDVNEAAEFGISLVASMKAKKKIYDFLDDQGCAKDEYGRIDPLCFRQNFLKGVCTEFRPHFPRLFQYLGIGAAGCDTNFVNPHNNAYVDSSIKAARFCNVYKSGEEIHYSEGDIMSILLAMMHIETTIIRWDANLNNTMDFEEVQKSYEIYEPAIQGMLPKLPDIINKPAIVEMLAKVVFKYLVKYEETPQTKWPDVLTMVKRLLELNLQAPAHRKTIASILWIVSEESKKKSIAAGEPQFDCEWLRDPDNIPRD